MTCRGLSERGARVRQRFQFPVLVAALLVLPVVFIEYQVDSGPWLQIAYWVNWVIWMVFLAEYVTVLRLADDKWAYTRSAWLDVLIIVSSFPLLGEMLASTRLFRLGRLGQVLRVVRLVRLAAVVSRGGMALRSIFRSHGLVYVIALISLLAVGASSVFAVAETNGTLADGLWWAIATITTVGYGDISPVTPLGRTAGAMLMILGIGLVAVFTAAIAAHFVEEDDIDLKRDVARIHDRMDDLERLLAASVPTSTKDAATSQSVPTRLVE